MMQVLLSATVNGAITVPTKNLAVDGNSGTIAVGARVLGAGISDGDEVVKVATVTSQTALILDKANHSCRQCSFGVFCCCGSH